MVIEDDDALRHLIRVMLLRHDRLRLDQSFDNAEDALDALRNGSCPQVILCDIGLPGMSGLDALPLLREECPNSVIVVYTGNPEGCGVAVRRDADAVVSKDVLPAELFEQVHGLI